MQSSKQQRVSPSTLYRYNKAHRIAHINQYLHFKNQYENYFNQGKIERVKQVYQHGVCGKNEHKHTVIVDRIGNIKINELHKVLEDDQLAKYTYQRLIEISEHMIEEREQIVWIFDLNGKIMQLASKKILDSLQKIIENVHKYFPGLLYRLIFVNTPMLFDTIWAKITPFITKQTLEKVVMIGDELSNLYQFASPSILPQFLGGDLSQEDFLAGKINGHAKDNEQDEESEEEVDFSSLKQALSDLKISGNSLRSVSQTPLNTEADDK